MTLITNREFLIWFYWIEMAGHCLKLKEMPKQVTDRTRTIM
nr:MAG TPA: hypothetical protein [Caudoviricetes sp.]